MSWYCLSVIRVYLYAFLYATSTGSGRWDAKTYLALKWVSHWRFSGFSLGNEGVVRFREFIVNFLWSFWKFRKKISRIFLLASKDYFHFLFLSIFFIFISFHDSLFIFYFFTFHFLFFLSLLLQCIFNNSVVTFLSFSFVFDIFYSYFVNQIVFNYHIYYISWIYIYFTG